MASLTELKKRQTAFGFVFDLELDIIVYIYIDRTICIFTESVHNMIQGKLQTYIISFQKDTIY